MATICKGRWSGFQEDAERDYSQKEYGTNALVVGDGGDGGNPQRCRCVREDSVDRK